MMRSLLFVLALCAAIANTTSQGWAAAFGSSIMNATNVRLQYFNGTSWVNATSTQATLVVSAITSQSSATLGGTTQASGLIPSWNAPQSFVTSTGMAVPVEGGGVPLTGVGPSAIHSFARGDTQGTGTSIIGGSVSTATLAELNDLAGVSGLANGNVGGTSIFQVNVNQGGQYRLAFTGNLGMVTEGIGEATNSFRVQVNQSKTDGTAVSVDYAPTELNRSISGTNTVTVSQNFFSPTVTLQAGPIATFTLTQNSTASAEVIPEPSSIAIFGLMSAGSLMAWRRRRANDRKGVEA
jgi:hypothetical protein